MKLKPSELYAMPDRGVSPWHDGWGRSLEDVFGVTDEQIDIEAAYEARDERILRHEKMSHHRDRDYSTVISVMSFDGKPFGIYVTAGSDDHQENHFLVTDRAAYDAALLHVQTFRRQDLVREIGDDFDLLSLGSLGSAVIAKGPEGYDLVSDEYAARDGTLVFDHAAFSDAHYAYVQKSRIEDPGSDERKGLMLDRLPDVTEIVRAGIPANLPYVVVNDWKPERGKRLPKDWIAAVAATDEGTYAYTVKADALEVSALRWEWGLDVNRIGGPELLQQYADKYGHQGGAPKP